MAYPFVHLHAERDADPHVAIYILSKQVRLLKRGAITRITITRGEDSNIRDETGSRLPDGKTIELTSHGGILAMHLDSRAVAGPRTLVISSAHDGDEAVVSIDGAVRNYPLPLTMRYGNNDLRISVVEHLGRYAVDSALAEYSGDHWKEKEALLALAHLIRARYYYAQKVRHHEDADFCDLTHCQVYRGRIRSPLRFNDEWVIDHELLRENLFFHSRCGGRTCDPGVFSGRKSSPGAGGAAVKDWLYREGTGLCSAKDSRWERTISNDDLASILFPGTHDADRAAVMIRYEMDDVKISITSSSVNLALPVETFRLKINRVRGWNYIRSNSFTVSEEILEGKKHFHFRGTGLGHGVGLCQHGAIALSRLGYNRYEILEHYYPDIQFKNIGPRTCLSPYCSYCLFDVETGKIITSTQGPGFLQRKVPPGSLFKLIVALYLAAERPDLFNDHSYNCTGRNRDDSNLPDRCWKPKGHGTVRMKDAIPNSCNLYFASLYNVIPEKKFRAFYNDFCAAVGINAPLPSISNEKQWAELLAGLDFRVSFTVSDCMRLARYLYCGNAGDGMAGMPGIKVPDQGKVKIFQGLQETFTRGTGFEQKKRSGAFYNYNCLEHADTNDANKPLMELWGKTSTVIDGTNKPESYGIFLGGNGTQGIIVILRKATGNMASRWAKRILSKTASGE